MKKVFSIAFTFVLLVSCSKREEIKPEIIIPAESVQVFSSGISFDASANSAIVKFKATDEWSTDATDTKASSWLSVHPPRGSAGDNSITVSALANPSTEERATIVSIVCGNVRKQFTVKQSGKPEEVIAVESVTLNESELILIKGGTAALSATVMPEDASDKTVVWSSSDTAIATVDESGKVTGVKEGKATITAKSGEKTATCEVTVQKKVIAVESITLNASEINLVKGSTATLSATVLPENATDKTVAWSSSDTAVATVDESGKVTGVNGGKAIITAKSGEKSATCEVTVTVPVESVALDQVSITIDVEQTVTLSATVTPEDASDKTVAWSSSDTAIATVDESGKVTGVSGGKAIITAKSGEKTATCEVTVTVPVESVALDQASITIDVEQTVTLSATVTPEDASDKTVAWSSSDTAIATVDESGKVTGVKEGKATITAKSGEKTATCEVTVQKKVIAVESITLNASEINLVKGSTATLSATVLPENATDKTVAWSSSDSTIATVDENGKVTGLEEGKATITAKAGEITAKCIVTVQREKVPAESISLNMTTAQIIIDERLQLTIKLKPAEASYEGVKWESSLPFVATVSDSGVVKGISAGKTIIKVSIGSLSASCEVTVIQFDPGESEGIGDGGSMDSANVNNQ